MHTEESRAVQVCKALNDYLESKSMDVNAGYNVLRYTKAGYIGIANPNFAVEFMAWYPRNPDYLILRMAAAGQLVYVPQVAPATATEEKNEFIA